ncbi:MAG: SGNH/GDSL hydrolase family protein, partial [Planctomycetota bacterium]|nr:SGNH/GDSL hydrolase family protein [Planctomycetota bacterium]
SEGKYPDIPSMIGGMKQFNDKTMEIAKAEGIPVVEVAGHVPQTTENFRDDVHLTPEGNKVVADIFFKFFVDNKIIENTKPKE